MIWQYRPVPYLHPSDYRSPFERGSAVLFLYFGHGEYGMPKIQNVDVKVWGRTDEDYDPPSWLTPAIQSQLLDASDLFKDVLSIHEGWADLVRLEGPVLDLWKTYYEFANRLDPQQDPADYTPGGDDDTYDYYPSAFQCMEMFAKDLDEIDRQFVEAGGPKRRFLAIHRVGEIVRNLYHARGKFEEWEFEEYAAPYLADIGLSPQE